MTSSPTAVKAVTSAVARRRQALRQQGQLRRELAAYDTPSARDDLAAVLARYDDAQSAPIHRILRGQWQAPVSHLSVH